MDEECVIDQGYGALHQPRWVEGTPQVSFWSGLKVRGKERLPITTYRCPACGYLESYAKAEEAQEG
jgi:hypothetical protein